MRMLPLFYGFDGGAAGEKAMLSLENNGMVIFYSGGHFMKHIEVAGAALVHAGKVLCMQRGAAKYNYVSYKYELPGGKLEPGESPAEALERELREELALTVRVRGEDRLLTTEYSYPDFSITLHVFWCPIEQAEFTRREHIAARWCDAAELAALDWLAADAPVVKRLAERLMEIKK